MNASLFVGSYMCSGILGLSQGFINTHPPDLTKFSQNICRIIQDYNMLMCKVAYSGDNVCSEMSGMSLGFYKYIYFPDEPN